ncbi:MAG: hypothetical protein ABIG92_05885 [Candidatus Omnitrophota bacterium]
MKVIFKFICISMLILAGLFCIIATGSSGGGGSAVNSGAEGSGK